MSEQSADSIQPLKARKSKHHFVRWALIVFGLLVAWLALDVYLFSKGGLLSRTEREAHENLKRFLSDDARRIAISKILPFQWESACMVAPYTSKKRIEEGLGRTFPSFEEPTWTSNEGFWTLLIVVDKGHLVPIRVPRIDIGDYELEADKWMKCAPRETAVLIKSKNRRGSYAVRFQISGK